MAKRTPGLRKRGQIWHIEKVIAGQLVRQSTGETELDKAERYLSKVIEDIRKVSIYGHQIQRTFDESAARYVEEFGHKRSLDRDIFSLKAIIPYIGHLPISAIHSGTLDKFINDRKKTVKAGTINRDLAIIKRILTLASRLWRDESGRAWLDAVPMFQPIQGDKRKPRPITYAEQDELLKHLPAYLAEMALFALNTGLRDQEICSLQWANECKVQGLSSTVFIITEEMAKNGRERIVPLNSIAQSIVESHRGNKSDYVFAYQGHKLDRMNNHAWRNGRELANLKEVRVHDLRHTFGMRLRSAGVSYEDRQDLLGHHSGRITTHYSKVEISRLIECVELLCRDRKTELTLIRNLG